MENPRSEPFSGEDKGKFADLGQGHPGQDRRPKRRADRQHRRGSRHKFADDHGADYGHDEQGIFQNHARIHEHADRDEKQAVEAVAKGEHLGQGLVTVFGFGDDESGDKGAEGDG